MRILLVGTGNISKEYAKVLKSLNLKFDVVGRGEDNCKSFQDLFPEVKVFSGGLETFKFPQVYTHAIVGSNIQFLAIHAKLLIDIGIEYILLEKPGGINLREVEELMEYVRLRESRIYIAYNRRFYSSVIECRKLIQEDGGVKSFSFEFTEWPHTFENIPSYDLVKKNLLFANSTHLIDMAFFIGGTPRQISAFATDGLDWHPKAIFAGAGITNDNALFSYHANWKGPGRWLAEFVTEHRRYIFKPLEILQIQVLRSVKVEQVYVDDSLDKLYKPGLYLQVKTFLFEPDNSSLINISKHAENCKMIYQTILDGNYDE
jgi:predicted dehydrogenase